MTPDLVNGLFEFGGGVLLWLNVRRLWRDRTVSGVSALPVVFWTAWGLWNLWFYPAVNCWASFAGGIFVVAANGAWLGLLLWIEWKKKKRTIEHPISERQKAKVRSCIRCVQEYSPSAYECLYCRRPLRPPVLPSDRIELLDLLRK